MTIGDEMPQPPESSKAAKVTRGALAVVGGAVPLVGGAFSAFVGAWSESEQEKTNRFFNDWLRMLHDELKEKQDTILQIMGRINLQDEVIAARVESKEYQSLVRKTFREWSGVESEEKRSYIRNILSNAAASSVSSDDVLKLYINWINLYSEMHFQVIGAIYNHAGITRGGIWTSIGKAIVREDSAEADLYKLLIRDLSTGSIIRQHRPVDYSGRFLAKNKTRSSGSAAGRPLTSAFDEVEGYELTSLGQQFIHYAMNELPVRISFSDEGEQ